MTDEILLTTEHGEYHTVLGEMTVRWLRGELPYQRVRNTGPGPRYGKDLTLEGSTGLRDCVQSQKGRVTCQYAADGTWMAVTYQDKSTGTVKVAAVSQELADKLSLILLRRLRRKQVTVGDGRTVSVTFWYQGRGPESHTRKIPVKPWDEIRQNYARQVQPKLDELMKLQPADINGRVILMHGAPGTGKTTLLRALGSAWREWCDTAYILDPDQALNSGTYMMEAMLDEEGTGRRFIPRSLRRGNTDESARRWRLIIMEDCGELFTTGARKESGQALSRLLNMADGILGQGCNLMFAMTTNETIGELHEAVMRPGRALANLDIPPLPDDEAAEWLGYPVPAGHSTTLAGLYELRGHAVITSETAAPMAGQYL